MSKRSAQRNKVVNREVECSHCNRYFTRWHFKRHERSCSENPKNKEECPVCGIEFFATNGKRTCSKSCSAQMRTDAGHRPPVPNDATRYQTIAFHHHEKKCAVCDEKRVLEVHHYNGNHDDDSPENLVPMCPTHHRYMHSKYRYIYEMAVDMYVEQRWGREINRPADYYNNINYELHAA